MALKRSPPDKLKQMRAADAAQAVKEAESEAKRVEDNTVRLRALRLAKEHADQAAAAPAPPRKRRKMPARRKP